MTVLVPAYDEEKVTAGCVAALREVDCPGLEIPVLNDGSKDSTVATARAAAAVGRGQTARAEAWARSGCTATAWS